MTVRENIGFGLTLAGAPKAEKKRAVDEAARILQMEHLLDRKPSQLSGGQRQRVAIGRSIVRKPKVFLFDEPLSNLDAALRVDMRMEIGKLHHDLDATMIYVTHDQVEAMTLADKIVVLRAGEVMQVGSPLELYHNPANQFVAGFLGSPKMNFLDVEVKDAANGRVTVASPALEPVSIPHAVGRFRRRGAGRCSACGRSSCIRASSPIAATCTARVSLVERLGTETVVNVELTAGGRIVVALDGDHAFDLGHEILLGFEPERAHLFPPS